MDKILRSPLWIRLSLAAGLLLMLALFYAGTQTGFKMDDYIFLTRMQVAETPLSADTVHMYRFGPAAISTEVSSWPWWYAPDHKMEFFRPLTSLTLIGDYVLHGGKSLFYHLHSYAWFFAMAALWAVWTRRHLPLLQVLASLFLLAGCLETFQALGWISNRHTLISMAFMLGAFHGHIRWMESGSRVALALSLVFLLFGLAAGEAALAMAAYPVAHTLTMGSHTRRRRWLSLLPAAAVVLLWLTGYVLAGFGVSGSSGYLDPLSDPLTFLQAAPLRLLVALGALVGPLNYTIAGFGPEAGALSGLLAALVLVLFGICLRDSRRGLDEQGRALQNFLLLAGTLSLVPVLCGIPSSRNLLVAMPAASCLMVQVFSVLLRSKAGETRRFSRVMAKVFIVLLFVLEPLVSWGFVQGGAAHYEQARRQQPHQFTGALQEKTWFVLGAHDAGLMAYEPFRARFLNTGYPDHIHMLIPGGLETSIRRIGPHSLEFTASGELFRSDYELMSTTRQYLAGQDRFDQEDFKVTVTGRGETGMLQYRIDFHKDLDDPSLVFVNQTAEGYRPVVLPRTGRLIIRGGQAVPAS